MKKFLVLAVALLVSSSVFAATTITTKATFTASVSFIGDVSFAAALASGSGTALTWNTEGITLDSSSSQWKQTTTTIKMTKSIGQANAKVYMYQDNKATGSGVNQDYVATTGRTESGKKVYSGLVKSGTGGGDPAYDGQTLLDMSYLPMAYYISTSASETLDFSNVEKSGDPNYGYRYFVDKSNEAVVDGSTKPGYYTVANVNGYIKDVDQNSNPEAIANTATVADGYVYIAANFMKVKPGFSYGTNKILFDLVTE